LCVASLASLLARAGGPGLALPRPAPASPLGGGAPRGGGASALPAGRGGGPSRGRGGLVLRRSALAPAAYYPTFKIDISDFTPEAALEKHLGACGDPPEVQIIRAGEEGVWAATGTLRLPAPALEVFHRLTDPEENRRIFARTCAAVNYRKLIEADEEARTRLFEVSKTGRWRLLGIPLSFESTVYALEDWRSLEIRFRLKKPGAMKHMSGFWRLVPIGARECLVLFYNEAEPNFPMPRVMRSFAGNVVREMGASLLEDLRESLASWPDHPVSTASSWTWRP